MFLCFFFRICTAGLITDKSDACWYCKVTVLQYIWIRNSHSCYGNSCCCVGYRCGSALRFFWHSPVWTGVFGFIMLWCAPVTSLDEIHRKWHQAFLYFNTTSLYGSNHFFTLAMTFPRGEPRIQAQDGNWRSHKSNSAVNPGSCF
jgi:hypothetical protein